MKIFAISDLHMSTASPKPMNIFGNNWDNYLEKIYFSWRQKVTDDDLVLIGGDISWAMYFEEALQDLNILNELPGKKILIRGNHDYWWKAITKLREELPKNFYALQNDSIKFEDIVICGSRLWSVEGSPDFKEADRKIYLREAERLKMSLNSAVKLRNEGDKLLCLVHYPPFNAKREDSLYTEIFEKFSVDTVIYGHLHGSNCLSSLKLKKNGINYFLTSTDQVNHELIEII